MTLTALGIINICILCFSYVSGSQPVFGWEAWSFVGWFGFSWLSWSDGL